MPNKAKDPTRQMARTVARMQRKFNPFVYYEAEVGNPPPVSNSAKRIPRTIVLSTAGNTADFTFGSISGALGHSGDFSVRRVRAWALATTGDKATFTCYPQFLMAGSPTNIDNVTVSDVGTATSLPSVRFIVPEGHAAMVNYDTASATKFLSCALSGVASVTWEVHVDVYQRVAG